MFNPLGATPVLFWAVLGALSVAIVSLGLLALAWGVLIERHLRVIRTEEQTLAVLAKAAEPIRILHISDFHLAPWQRRKLEWISTLGGLNVDLVVNTGDNLGHPDAIAPALKAIQPLGAKPGVFVNGSNDYFAPKPRNPLSYLRAPSERVSETPLDTAQLVSGFESLGWLNLNNRGGQLVVKGSRIGFVGIDDMHDGLADLESVARSVAEIGAVDALIGVSHAPYLAAIDAMNDSGVSVLFAGHTHGGQVCVPGFGALVTNCDLPRKAAKGLSSWSRNGRQIWLNVCAGLGTSIYAPVRFACRPEVRIITLVARAE
jgi:predicted MPP superfamily phosphohydrolase